MNMDPLINSSVYHAALHNRELAQKPHEPHAAFWHWAKPHAEIKFELTEEPS
jgi:hypothetical protein